MHTHEMLALDWGTSSLRAFLMQSGKVIDTRQSGHGIQRLPVAGIACGISPSFRIL